ncbi:MAG: MFS transporter [bacterium]
MKCSPSEFHAAAAGAPAAARHYGWSVVFASWLAVFCLFGYRATFAILKGPMAITLGWSTSEVTLGYSLMMAVYAVSAYFSGMILDQWGTKPVYAVAAVFGSLGFLLTARVDTHLAYLFTFSLLGGIATGMLWVASTVSVRKWYVGKSYATMWGFAFAGGPMAQFILSQLVKPILSASQARLDLAIRPLVERDALTQTPRQLALAIAEKLRDPSVLALPEVKAALLGLEHAWRYQMIILGVILFIALVVAVLVARQTPERYGMKPFGADLSAAGAAGAMEQEWTTAGAFSQYAIWAVILMFLTSMMGEFLIWTQVVSYWTQDVGFSLQKATNIYAFIGLVGIFSMPIMGRIADQVVQAMGCEARGRKLMLICGPATGVLACALLLSSPGGDSFAYASCVIFAIYWAIVPGGVVGYTGAIYGRKTLGRIWGLTTMIVMGVGPFTGSYVGGVLQDISGHYTGAICFALGAFLVSAIVATTLPLTAGGTTRRLSAEGPGPIRGLNPTVS